MAIVDEDLERLRATISISDVVQQWVALRRVGRNWVGLCPFHAERTGSFNVREETGRYKCFGCGAAGDVFKFVQEIEHVDFVNAVEQLAAKAGIQLRYTSGGESKDRHPLMPMLTPARPLRLASSRSRAKCGARALVVGRDAHEAGDRQLQPVAAQGDEGFCLARQDAGLLRLFPDIDLDEKRRQARAARRLGREGVREPLAVERLDDVEQGQGVAQLVGLQRPDEVQLDAAIALLQRRPAPLRLLHTVLREHTLAGIERSHDALFGLPLADGDQRGRGDRPAGLCRGSGYS